MILYYSIANSKTQPHSRPFGGIFRSEEWVENFIQNLFGYAITGIDKVYFEPVRSLSRLYGERSGTLHGIDGIQNYIHENLFHEIGIYHHLRHRVVVFLS